MSDAVAPKYLLNATPVVMGGGLQASVAFILEAMADVSINWHFLISIFFIIRSFAFSV